MASKPKIAKKKNGYQMPKKLPIGSVIQDTSKQLWITGPSIGTGGFGEIYTAAKKDEKHKNVKNYPYVVKIEPHGNGPLFVEMHFYMRNAKLDDIEAFKKKRNLTSLGMPHFIGSGSHELEGEKHRFVVMPRYGRDIWSIYLENGKKFSIHTVYRLALQMLDVLEYIHNCTYVHADLKGANMLLQGDSQVYLVDFGLAAHYTTNHEYKPDPKKMHNGTIEYTSRDAHNGVLTMRGDLEILAYNLLHWTGEQLPWEKYLNDLVQVQNLKEKFMKDPLLSTKNAAAPISNFVKLIANLKFDQKPDYGKCKNIFEDGLKFTGHRNSGPLEFANKSCSKNTSRKADNVPKEVQTKKDHASRAKTTKDSKPDSVKNEDSKFSKSPNSKSSGTIILDTPKKGKAKKIYQFNIDLDVSVDADVVINVNRKEKKARSKSKESPNKISTDELQTTSRPRKRKHQLPENGSDEASNTKRAQRNIPQISLRAGEYKGKKAKQ